MRTPGPLRPRDATSGANAIFLLSSCAASVIALAALVSPGHLGASPLRWVSCALVLLSVPAARALRSVSDPTHWCWTIVPFAWTAVYAVAAIGLRNPDMHAELFMLFPAMLASRQLSRPVALGMIGLATGLMPLLAITRSDTREALFVALFGGAAIFASTARLTITGRRIDGVLAEMQSRASTDALTGLGTRGMLEVSVDGTRHGDQQAGQALLLIDVDNFKLINDEYGHPAGDAVLVQLAAIMRVNCRAADLPCRIGGDELAILYRGVSREAAQQRADAIRSDVERVFFALPCTTPIRVTVSLGVAHTDEGRARFAQLYDAADRALYRAKRAGRNAVALHEAA